jgi:hypothetical protein
VWPDIEKVSIAEKIPAAVRKLPRTIERLAASLFLAGHTPFEWKMAEVEESRKLQIKSWLSWASIVAIPAPAVGDPLHHDLIDIRVGDEWIGSEERRQIYADPLLAVLFELRNYEVHVELRIGETKNFRTMLGSDAAPDTDLKEMDFGDELFISPVDFPVLSQLRNVQSRRSRVTPEMVAWFNRQASTWPAAYLIATARERYTTYIARFLQRHGIE